jgi:hypothetical protein
MTGGYRQVAARPRDRRRVPRYPCLARVHAGDRVGLTVNISSDGLSFHTMDAFQPSESVELRLAFDSTPLLEVVQTGTIVWATPADHSGSWRVGVKFSR